MKIKIRNILLIARRSFRELIQNDPLRMAGATAFFTIFALPPILIILIQVFGTLFSKDKVTGELLAKIRSALGEDTVTQITKMLEGFHSMASNRWITLLGIVFILFSATTIFKVIKGSLNQIWKIKSAGKSTFASGMKNRLRFITVILVAGALFMIGVASEGLQVILGSHINEVFSGLASWLKIIFNSVSSVFLVTVWFFLLFYYIPDGKPSFRVCFSGAVLTSLLFTAGKLIFRSLISSSRLQTVYGASGSIVLLLLFVFYSSLILYFGAAFIKIWAAHLDEEIEPKRQSRHYTEKKS